MKIKETEYNFKGKHSKRAKTDFIILHHRAGDGDAKSIHASHLALGWSGIGYHFYVRKDGSVYRGRPQDTVGAHCAGGGINLNPSSVGVCFEGNFETEQMGDAQLDAGRELVCYLKGIYPDAKVGGHNEFMATACPGKNFPMEKMLTAKVLESANDIVWELDHSYFEILDKDKFVKELETAKKNNSSLYWGYYKLVNKGDK